jgi:MFS family permease
MATAAEAQPRIQDAALAGSDAEKKDDSSSDLEHQHADNPIADATSDGARQHYEKWKKWTILSIVFLVQVSMNFNTSLYSNAVPGISKEFGVSAQAARLGAALFLITYAFGCELWAPWSEELGRWPVLQLSLFFVNIWQIPVGIAPNFGTILAFRSLGGLSTAGGSVTLAMVADMWEANEQQYAVVSHVTTLYIEEKH